MAQVLGDERWIVAGLQAANRVGVLEALGKEWRSADPNDPNQANRREQAGYVYQDPSTGKSDWWVNPNQQVYGGDACNSFFGAGPGNGVVLATAAQYLTHVHPFAPGESLPVTNCNSPRGEAVRSLP